jgi:hypothetical protein
MHKYINKSKNRTIKDWCLHENPKKEEEEEEEEASETIA